MVSLEVDPEHAVVAQCSERSARWQPLARSDRGVTEASVLSNGFAADLAPTERPSQTIPKRLEVGSLYLCSCFLFRVLCNYDGTSQDGVETMWFRTF